MASKPLIYLIFDDLVAAVNGIAEKTYLDRPKLIAEEVKNFIVVDIPTEIRGRLKGDMDVMAGCYAVYYVFVRSKTNGTPNIGSQTSIVESVLNAFPISTKHITATEPSVLMKGDDGYGFHVTTITFKLRTKFNATRIINSQNNQ